MDEVVEDLYFEGEYMPLVREYSGKYTHHPIAAAQDLSKSKSLRHIPFEALVNFCKAYGDTSSSWVPSYYGRKDAGWMAANAINIKQTKANIAYRHGTACITCDNIAWSPSANDMEVKLVGDFKDFERMEAICLAQREVIQFCTSGTDHGNIRDYPVVCEDCLGVINRSKNPKLNRWYYEKTNVLRGLISLLEQQIPKYKKKRAA